ncbi:MAG: DUF2271 domain-containing protein [Oscillospiraceae bacterium]|nr:DUF2271 domain-containing protein [Oscillospiraceae bacterium]
MTRKTCRHRKNFFQKATPAQLLLCIFLCLTLGLSVVGCAGGSTETKATTKEKVTTTTAEPTPVPSEETGDGQTTETTSVGSLITGELEITLNYKKIDDIASNQYAVWIEDSDGNMVRTLYVTSFTADGGWEFREDSLTVWVERSGMGSEDAPDIDAFSGATPKSGPQTYIWDCTDEEGQPVPAGTYHFFVDATIFWEDAALYTGTIVLGGEEATAVAEPVFTNDDASASGMITDVMAVYRP